MKYFMIICSCLLCIRVFAQKAKSEFPKWEKGYMDIHHINTGCGECAYIVFPDGTTLLIDAGENNPHNLRHVPQRPNENKSAGEWIVDYINQMMPERNRKIDYALITHFHNDHVGGVLKSMNESGKYYNTGIITVAEKIGINTLVDRGFPNYDFLVNLKDKCVKNYLDFLRHTKQKMAVEKFTPGVSEQFKLRNDSLGYSESFKVQNIYANGLLWTGHRNEVEFLFPNLNRLPTYDIPQENTLSCALKISYGNFSYYTGGDVTGYPKPGRGNFHDVETHLAPVVGKTEVCCVNHHGYNDATNESFISALSPRVFIIQSSDALHPNHSTLERMLSKYLYPAERDVFATNLHPSAEVVIGENANKMKSKQGHIVIRVSPQGKEYEVFILEDSDAKRRVKQRFGPYICHEN